VAAPDCWRRSSAWSHAVFLLNCTGRDQPKPSRHKLSPCIAAGTCVITRAATSLSRTTCASCHCAGTRSAQPSCLRLWRNSAPPSQPRRHHGETIQPYRVPSARGSHPLRFRCQRRGPGTSRAQAARRCWPPTVGDGRMAPSGSGRWNSRRLCGRRVEEVRLVFKLRTTEH
jgi:hypothetical protein